MTSVVAWLEFFVRVANGTKPLNVVEREKYILGRWGTGTA
jgi:hypothetical protein